MSNQLQVLASGVSGKMADGKINTSISVDKELWNKFCSIVVGKHGNRHVSIILEELIKDYIKKNQGGIQ